MLPVFSSRFEGDSPELRLELADAVLSRERDEPGIRASNVHGWHSRPDLLKWPDPSVRQLRAWLTAAVGRHQDGPLRMHAWANVMRAGSYHVAHRHGDASWSGVYYVASGGPGAGGRITFARGDFSRLVAPEDGLLLIFPGDLLHSVERYQGTLPRISIAFNVAPPRH